MNRLEKAWFERQFREIKKLQHATMAKIENYVIPELAEEIKKSMRGLRNIDKKIDD